MVADLRRREFRKSDAKVTFELVEEGSNREKLLVSPMFLLPFRRSGDETMRSEEGYRAGTDMFFPKLVSVGVRESKEESPLASETGLAITPLTIGDTVYRGEGNANIVIALPHVSR